MQIKKTNFFILLSFILVLVITLSTLLFHIRVISVEAPQEAREGAIWLTTNLILKGENPYALKNMPTFTNAYGILYNLVVLPFAKIFGVTFVVHRLISFIFVLASCSLIFKAVKEEHAPTWLAIVSSTFLYVQMAIGAADILTMPDSLGFFLFLFSIYISKKLNYNVLGLTLTSICSLLGFLDKPYFILGLPYVILYLFLFKPKANALLLFISNVILYLLVFIIIQSTLETYFLNTLFINYQVAKKDVHFLLLQIKEYLHWNYAPLLILLFSAIISVRKNITNIGKRSVMPFLKLNITEIRKPLLSYQIDIYTLALVLSSILIVFKFGLHTGNYMVYFTHLITPFLFLVTFKKIAIEKGLVKNFFLCIVIVNLLTWSNQLISANSAILIDNRNGEYWSNIIHSYHEVYASALFTDILYHQNKQIYDNGQSEYFVASLPLNRKLSLVKEADKQYQTYVSSVRLKIVQKKFDLVLIARDVTPFDSPYFTKEELLRNYYPVKTLTFTMYSGSWIIGIWVPR